MAGAVSLNGNPLPRVDVAENRLREHQHCSGREEFFKLIAILPREGRAGHLPAPTVPLHAVLARIGRAAKRGCKYTDAGNRIDHIDYPNNQRVQYAYYGSGTPAEWERLQSITNYPTTTSIASFISQFGYGYNAAGDIASWAQQTGTNTAVPYGYGYNGADELLSAIKTSSTASGALDTYAYRYDAAGNRLGWQLNDTVTSAAYNNLNQVTSVSGTGLLMISGSLSQSGTGPSEPGTVTVGSSVVSTDSNGVFTIYAPVVAGSNAISITAASTGTTNNVTTKTLGVNVTSGTPIPSLKYDLNGSGTNDGTFTYEWDAANRLTAVNEPGGWRSEFKYDGLGRRVCITEKSSGTVTSVKNLIWDGMTIREERNASNAVTKMYFGNGVQINGTNYYYTRDHLGSIREMTTGTSATVVARYDYDPYGVQTQSSGTMTSDFGFTGLYYHQPSGLILAPYREYSSNLDRWLSRDPLDDAEMRQGPNLYEYVRNNPINAFDLLGMFTQYNYAHNTNNGVQSGRAACALGNEVGNLLSGVPDLITNLVFAALFDAPPEESAPRTEPANLTEQLTMEEAQAGAGEPIMAGKINDPNYPPDQYSKMQHVHKCPNGQNVTIHYWKNLSTNVSSGFKFK